MLTFILAVLIIVFCLSAISALGAKQGWVELIHSGLSLAALIGLLVLRKAGLV